MDKIEKFLVVGFFVLWFIVSCSGCSWHNLAPTGLAGVGAGVGSLGGVGGAVAGGLAGGAIGQIIEKSEDADESMAQKVEMVKALTEGDAKKLIEAGLADQKGWIEQTIDSIIDLAILCGIGLLAWNILPIFYSRYLHKKTLKS